MTKEEAEKILEDNQFTVFSSSVNGPKTISVHAMDQYGINVTVQLEDSSFTVSYMVPRSIARVVIGPCSPFDEGNHFKKQVAKMKGIVMDLRYREVDN